MELTLFSVIKTFHLTFVFIAMMALMAMIINYHVAEENKIFQDKAIAAIHGISLLLILISGLGMAHVLKIQWANATWLYVKFFLWIFLGFIGAFIKRKPDHPWQSALLVLLLGTAAAAMAILKAH